MCRWRRPDCQRYSGRHSGTDVNNLRKGSATRHRESQAQAEAQAQKGRTCSHYPTFVHLPKVLLR